ncbi:hypothetical protein CMI37_30990 [Candidatus Pacearchaeota archaeon]|nr:hypothetical protein [Candidatus Pacearchaeota archaeon]|tara:strand:- start:3072 stop:3542 length:471 start_codon:yes stop_codon:yes gene_type:complete
MPKVNVPVADVWQGFELDTELITPTIIRLRLKPAFKKEIVNRMFSKAENLTPEEMTNQDVLDSFRQAVEYSIDLITDWDLTGIDDKKIPCTKANKKTYLDPDKGKKGIPLFWEQVKRKEAEDITAEEDDDSGMDKIGWFWVAVFRFCSDMGNFIKN